MLSAALARPLVAAELAREWAREWEVIAAESHLAFHGSMMGVPAVGYFRDFDSEILFDPDDLRNARVVVDINMASVDSSHDERDTALRLPEWFSTMVFPRARFETTEIRQTGDFTYEATGSLTIKGITKDISLPFTLSIDGDNAVVTGSADLSRSDFAIGSGEWASDRLVAFDVRVEFRLVARAVAPR